MNDRVPALVGIDHRFERITTNGVCLRCLLAGDGPLVLLVHGWPECWYSWRHQVAPLVRAGYRVVVPDVRGYGGSDRPAALEAYDMPSLIGDLLGLIDALGEEQAVLVGHDWGAPVVWNTAALHPARVRAVMALSVPFLPRGEQSAIATWRELYAGRFFYQLYFQQPGVAEAELEADVRRSLRMIYFNLSGDAPKDAWLQADAAADARLLDGLADPEHLPEWFTEFDLDYYTAEYERTGFGAPLNRYRNQQRDWELLPELSGARVTMPSALLVGSKEIVLSFVPGVDLIENMKPHLDDLRMVRIVDGAGHWLQQEQPDTVNAALLEFLAELEG